MMESRTRWFRRTAAVCLVVFSLPLVLGACGKRGSLAPPQGASEETIQRSDRVINHPDNPNIEF